MNDTLRNRFLTLAQEFAAGRMSLKAFDDAYYDPFLEAANSGSLGPDELALFGEIQEKLDWVDPAPDEDARAQGWLDEDEMRRWVLAKLASYLGER